MDSKSIPEANQSVSAPMPPPEAPVSPTSDVVTVTTKSVSAVVPTADNAQFQLRGQMIKATGKLKVAVLGNDAAFIEYLGSRHYQIVKPELADVAYTDSKFSQSDLIALPVGAYLVVSQDSVSVIDGFNYSRSESGLSLYQKSL